MGGCITLFNLAHRRQHLPWLFRSKYLAGKTKNIWAAIFRIMRELLEDIRCPYSSCSKTSWLIAMKPVYLHFLQCFHISMQSEGSLIAHPKKSPFLSNCQIRVPDWRQSNIIALSVCYPLGSEAVMLLLLKAAAEPHPIQNRIGLLACLGQPVQVIIAVSNDSFLSR